jgi:hypothetical protein
MAGDGSAGMATMKVYVGLFDKDIDDVADRLSQSAADALRTDGRRKA